MTEHVSAHDQTDRPYVDEFVDVSSNGDWDGGGTEASAADRRVIAYVNDVVGVKGTSNEPALAPIEYVQYVTSDQRRRRKAGTALRLHAAIPR